MGWQQNREREGERDIITCVAFAFIAALFRMVGVNANVETWMCAIGTIF